MDAVAFKKYFLQWCAMHWNIGFKDNYIKVVFRVLTPNIMFFRQVGLVNQKIIDLELLYTQHGVERDIKGRNIFLLVNFVVIKIEFLHLNFKHV